MKHSVTGPLLGLLAVAFVGATANPVSAQNNFAGLSCPQTANIARKLNDYGYESLQAAMREAGISKPLNDMGEAEGRALFARWKECDASGQSGGIFFMTEKDVTKPFLKAVGAAKADNANGAAFTAMMAKLEQLEQDIVAQRISADTAQTRLSTLVGEIKPQLGNLSHNDEYKIRDKVDSINKILAGNAFSSLYDEFITKFIAQYDALKGKTSVADIAAMRDFIKQIEEGQGKLQDFEWQSASDVAGNKNFEAKSKATHSKMLEMRTDISNSIGLICKQEAKRLCAELLPDFPAEFVNDYVVHGANGDITIFEFVCAAKNKGLFKKFNTGGILSSEISLELHSGTIFFERKRYDLATAQIVDSSFKGPDVVNLLVAKKFISPDGKTQEIMNPGTEVGYTYLQFGGLPRAPECTR